MKHDNLASLYAEEFYKSRLNGSQKSAKAVLSLLYKFYSPSSVVDVGCGRGAWLAAAEILGSKVLRGFDGAWVNSNDLMSNQIDFSAVSLECELDEERKFDLCISLEVAEHLHENRARPFVESLCGLSNVVLFSAAIEGQRGTHHVHERCQSYWVGLFDNQGYEPFFFLRSKLWQCSDVDFWYRQNMVLYVRKNAEIRIDGWREAKELIIDVVHPEQFRKATVRILELEHDLSAPTIRSSLKGVTRALRARLKFMLNGFCEASSDETKSRLYPKIRRWLRIDRY